MTNTNLLQAMGRIDPKLIADAAPDVPQKRSANRAWVKWGALVACFCLIVGGSIAFWSGPNDITNEVPNDTTNITNEVPNDTANDTPISDAHILLRQLQQLGLDPQSVDDPIPISGSEIPRETREGVIYTLKNHAVVYGTVEKVECVKIPCNDMTWYITEIEISVSEVLNGDIEVEKAKIVSASISNITSGFLFAPQIDGIREGQTAAFALKEIDSDMTWDIFGIEVNVRDLGDYMIDMRLWRDGNILKYQEYSIELSELE